MTRHSVTLKGTDMTPYKRAFHNCREWDFDRHKYFMHHYPIKNGICESCGTKIRRLKK